MSSNAADEATHPAAGVGGSHGGEGQAQDDGFTGCKAQVGNPPRTRWDDAGPSPRTRQPFAKA